jgi:hypothetical protein
MFLHCVHITNNTVHDLVLLCNEILFLIPGYMFEPCEIIIRPYIGILLPGTVCFMYLLQMK